MDEVIIFMVLMDDAVREEVPIELPVMLENWAVFP